MLKIRLFVEFTEICFFQFSFFPIFPTLLSRMLEVVCLCSLRRPNHTLPYFYSFFSFLFTFTHFVSAFYFVLHSLMARSARLKVSTQKVHSKHRRT